MPKATPTSLCGGPLREDQGRLPDASEGVLFVCALREDGFREILAIEVVDVESEVTYQELISDPEGLRPQRGEAGDFRRA